MLLLNSGGGVMWCASLTALSITWVSQFQMHAVSARLPDCRAGSRIGMQGGVCKAAVLLYRHLTQGSCTRAYSGRTTCCAEHCCPYCDHFMHRLRVTFVWGPWGEGGWGGCLPCYLQHPRLGLQTWRVSQHGPSAESAACAGQG